MQAKKGENCSQNVRWKTLQLKTERWREKRDEEEQKGLKKKNSRKWGGI